MPLVGDHGEDWGSVGDEIRIDCVRISLMNKLLRTNHGEGASRQKEHGARHWRLNNLTYLENRKYLRSDAMFIFTSYVSQDYTPATKVIILYL